MTESSQNTRLQMLRASEMLHRELTAAAAGRRPQHAALKLLAFSRLALDWALEAQQWGDATTYGSGMGYAMTALNRAAQESGGHLPETALAEVKGYAEKAAYAGHRDGTLLTAAHNVEAMTSIFLESRMFGRSMTPLGSELADNIAEQRVGRLAQGLVYILELLDDPELPPLPATGDREELLRWERDYFRCRLDHVVSAERWTQDVYPLLDPQTYASWGQRATGRTALYLIATAVAGCAIRLSPTDAGVAHSIELEALTLEAIRDQSQRTTSILREAQRGRLSRRQAGRLLQEQLDWVGTHVWAPLAEAWPDLMTKPLAVIPVADVALLPLYCGTLDGVPVCATADLAMLPSARALAMAALAPRPAGDVLVASDEWLGLERIPEASREARAVAAVYGIPPIVLREAGEVDAPGADRTFRWLNEDSRADAQEAVGRVEDGVDFVDRLSRASIIHLACHGRYVPQAPLETALLLGGIRPLGELIGGNLLAGPLVVLSGCQLAGIGDRSAGEQVGFPAALLSMGARGVIGAQWPVPDHKDTVALMTNLHSALCESGPAVALGLAIGAQHSAGVPASVWGGFAYYGADPSAAA